MSRTVTASRGARLTLLLAASAALGLLCFDLATVSVALPSARVDLGSSTSGVIWVQLSWLLALAVVHVPLAALEGLLDRRVVTGAGIALLAGGALLASGADSTAALVTARAIQGAGAAAVLASALGVARSGSGRATLALLALPLAALALGPLVGGALSQEASWRWLFRLEAPLALLAAPLLLAGASGDLREPGRAWLAHAAAAVGVVCAAIGLVQAEPWGWGSAEVVALLAAGAVLLALAWRSAMTALAAAAIAAAGSIAVGLLFVPEYLELARGLSPLRSGVLTLSIAALAAALAPAGAVLSQRGRTSVPLAGGLAAAALGALAATRIDAQSSYALVIASSALGGAGAGAAIGALAGEGAARGGDLPTVLAGTALVLAGAGAVFQSAQLEEREAGASFEEALATGLAGTGWLLAVLLAVAALSAWRARAG